MRGTNHPGSLQTGKMKIVAATFLSTLILQTYAFSPSISVTRSATELYGRTPFITGNWKLNPQTKDEAVELAGKIASKINADSPKADVALFVPYVFIEAAMAACGDKLMVGAEVRLLL